MKRKRLRKQKIENFIANIIAYGLFIAWHIAILIGLWAFISMLIICLG